LVKSLKRGARPADTPRVTIAAVLGAWCGVSVLVGIVFGQIGRSREELIANRARVSERQAPSPR
jgi:hypothetical protein